MRFYILISLICLTGCMTTNDFDERLLGSWKSNKDQTIERFLKTHPEHIKKLGKKKFDFFKSMFGKLEVTYNEYEYRLKLGDYEDQSKYSIVEKGKDYVIIKGVSDSTVGDKEQLIRFVENGYWLKPNTDSEFMEKFDKMKPAK